MDALPDRELLDDLEGRVLQRIRGRAALRARIVTGAAVAALLVGAVVLVRPAVMQATSASSGSAGGSAASAAVPVHCHDASGAGSRSSTVPLRGPATARSAAAACERAAAASSSGGSSSTSPAPAPVVCRDAHGGFAVFPPDAHPATLCTRNGLRAG